MILSQYLTVTIENMIIPLTTPWFIVPSFASEFPHPRDCSRPSAGASWPSDCLATVRGTHLRISALELFWTRRNIGIDAKHLGLKRLNIHFSRETSKKTQEVELITWNKKLCIAPNLRPGQEVVDYPQDKNKYFFCMAPFKQWLITSIKYNYRHQI